MFKAVLIISALSGVGSDYKVPMETMEECLDARVTIEKQDPYVSTICIPAVDEKDKIKEFFNLFKSMINEMQREKDEFNRLEQCDRQWDECNKQSNSSSVLRKE
tara:strand:- start:209 stop:520 length:312 start_codon:yes stop_codon:yes gene_type:complete